MLKKKNKGEYVMYLLHVTSYSQRELDVKVINLQFHNLWSKKKKKNPLSYVVSYAFIYTFKY